jgi:DNA-binding response OmpR family regulator
MNISDKYKILIVDDDVNVVKNIMCVLIKNPDYLILTTSNGKSACEIANTERLDLIIMDWQMPVMDGIEATRELKRNDATKEIPIIISTGIMIDSCDLDTALTAGAVDYLRKPADEIELMARVANMLRLSKANSIIKQQNLELQSQLSAKLINIQQLNELKNVVAKNMTLLRGQVPSEGNHVMKDIVVNTERLLYSKAYEIDWSDFESNFEFIHQGFYKKLQVRNGDLTPNELRMCTFIKLNMTNKEIALITFTSPDSVNTARKRLKKKLGLLPSDSLQMFIRNL